MIAPSMLVVGISAANDPSDGDVDISCTLMQQDASRRKPCPAGQSTLIDAMRAKMGLSVADRGHGDSSVFAMPILTQDRGIGVSSTLALSHGELSDPEIVTQSNTETISLSLSDATESGLAEIPYKVDLFGKIKAKTGLEPDVIISAKTIGRLYDSAGNLAYSSGIIISVSGDDLRLRVPVVGSVSVSYAVSGQLQTASIAPREGTTTNNYTTTLWAASSCGKVEYFEIDVPDCYQLSLLTDVGDGDGGGVSVEVIDPLNDDEPNYDEPRDISFEWSVCCNKKLTSGDRDYFKDIPAGKDICYPGVACDGSGPSSCGGCDE